MGVVATVLSETVFVGVSLGLFIVLAIYVVGSYRTWDEADRERAKLLARYESDNFRYFAERFAGWLRSHEITAPVDMTPVLGTDYEAQQAHKLEVGEISLERYKVLVRPFIAREEWKRELHADYHRHWRAEVKQHFAWADQAGKMEDKDRLALLFVDRFFEPEQARQMADTLQRIGGRF